MVPSQTVKWLSFHIFSCTGIVFDIKIPNLQICKRSLFLSQNRLTFKVKCENMSNQQKELPSAGGSSTRCWNNSRSSMPQYYTQRYSSVQQDSGINANSSPYNIINSQATCWRVDGFTNLDFNHQWQPLLPTFTPHQRYSENVIPQVANPFGLHRSQSAYSSNKSSRFNRKRSCINREWQTTRLGAQVQKRSKAGFIFSLMNYNVLAQDLITDHMFLYKNHDSRALAWNIRWKNLLHEIQLHNADILCFQEVQESHLQDYYNAELTKLGYLGLYKRRTGFRTDGCALYFKENVFNLVEHHTIEYNQGQIRVLDRDNVAIIAKLESKTFPGHEVIVATTHLLYNPRREDVRLAQIQVLLSEVDRIAYKKVRKDNDSIHVPVIITGDFNMKTTSPCYELITKGLLKYSNLSGESLKFSKTQSRTALLPNFLGITDNCQHAALVEERKIKHLSRDDELELIALQHSERNLTINLLAEVETSLFGTGSLSHDLNLKSAFQHKSQFGTEATTYQNEWITVDYLFYSGKRNKNNIIDDKLKLVEWYTLPYAEQLNGVTIPNWVLGSDHFSLLAKFKLEC